MIPDAIAYAKRCHACQVRGDFIHQAPGHLRYTISSWPFEIWGMDVIGPIIPPLSKGYQFILIITDDFFKWAEAIPLREVKASDVVKFVKHHIIYRLVYPDGLFMIMDPSSSAKLFRGYATSSESRAYPQ